MITDFPNLEHDPFYIYIMIIRILMVIIIHYNNIFYLDRRGAIIETNQATWSRVSNSRCH